MAVREPDISMEGKPRTVKVLVGDIGGTKTNLAVYEMADDERPALIGWKSYSSRGADRLEAIIDGFLKDRIYKVEGACFSIAGPVIGGVCKTTNLPWTVAEDSLQEQYGWPVTILNDLAATGFGVGLLRDSELYILQDGHKQREEHTIALISPGTGLGTAILRKHGDEYLVVGSEGGHADFAPNNEEQVDLWRYVLRLYGHASIERVASGLGIVNIFNWLVESGGFVVPEWLLLDFAEKDKAQAIGEGAMLREDPLCCKVLQIFCEILGAVAGNLALNSLPGGGVYLGGGIPPKILSLLDSGLFVESFVSKGRFRGLLESIPVKVILNERAPLLGAADVAFSKIRG